MKVKTREECNIFGGRTLYGVAGVVVCRNELKEPLVIVSLQIA
jgi:hypothetical protein